MVNIMDYLLSEISEASANSEFSIGEINERLTRIEGYIISGFFISEHDREKLLSAVSQVRKAVVDALLRRPRLMKIRQKRWKRINKS